jgi:cytoskeletal protein CcmA (bactofilin family)
MGMKAPRGGVSLGITLQLMARRFQSISDWRTRLEPILVKTIRKLNQNAVARKRFLLPEQPRRAILNRDRRTEEHPMAEKADDLGIPINLRPSPGTTVPPRIADPLRSGAVPARAPGSPQQPTEESVASRANEVDRRTLIIGEGISLSGEVTSCDRLIVEGTIEAKLEKCQHVIIAETGVFNGNASTENADVRGRFQGELVVRKRLLIRAGGHVSGTITYGEIEIESGGKISGAIEEPGAVSIAPSLLPIRA